MRRLLLTLLASLVVVPAALAAPRATGDGVLELKAVYGTVSIGTIPNPARGALWGQIDKGTVSVVDPILNDGAIYVTGYETKKPVILDSGYTKWVYSGTDIHFRVTGGKYKLTFSGAGLDLTAVGAGTAVLNGSEDALDAGYYAVDGGKWQPMPISFLPLPAPQTKTVSFPADTTNP